MGKAIAEISVVPLGTGGTSISGFVSEIEKKVLQQKKVKSLLTPMGTILEGELDAVLRLIREIHEVPFRMGAKRVASRILIDDRRDKKMTMESKVRSVVEKMKRGPRKK